jgi:hypothetical protein
MRRRIADIAQKTRFQRICLEGADSEYRSALLRKEKHFQSGVSITSLIIIGRSSMGSLRLVRRAAFKIQLEVCGKSSNTQRKNRRL